MERKRRPIRREARPVWAGGGGGGGEVLEEMALPPALRLIWKEAKTNTRGGKEYQSFYIIVFAIILSWGGFQQVKSLEGSKRADIQSSGLPKGNKAQHNNGYY